MSRAIAVLGAVALSFSVVACSQTDAGVTTKVKSKLATDDTVKAYQIDVDTNDHVVTLSGDVETMAARERALLLTRETDGVKDVVDRLKVAGGDLAAPGEYNTAPAGDRDITQPLTDAALTTAVKTKFLADDTVSGLRIDVDTKDGVVTLSGRVKTASEKAEAADIASRTDGVKRVQNKLTVGPTD